jgi:hypothetical protein
MKKRTSTDLRPRPKKKPSGPIKANKTKMSIIWFAVELLSYLSLTKMKEQKWHWKMSLILRINLLSWKMLSTVRMMETRLLWQVITHAIVSLQSIFQNQTNNSLELWEVQTSKMTKVQQQERKMILFSIETMIKTLKKSAQKWLLQKFSISHGN